MNLKNLPWDWIQSFVTVAKLGSLSKAALELGCSQPTLSRHMAALERHLNVTLFDRSTQGLKLTSVGSMLVESSESMNKASQQFTRIASGTLMSLEGSIRISANEVIGLYYLPEIISEFNQVYPQVQIEIVISNNETSINKRDADIALRMFRPTQVDLIAKRLPNIELGFVASQDYLQNHPEPQLIQDINTHNLIGYDQDIAFKKVIKKMGWPITDKNFISRTDFMPLQIELARQGMGISITHKHLLKRFNNLMLILEDIPLPPLEFWLVCHADVQHNRKIRLMMDFLSDSLEKKISNKVN